MLRRLALLAALAAACAAFGVPAAAQGPAGLSPVATDFSSPVYVTSPPADGRRLMVVERGGSVRVVRDGAVLPEPFLRIDSDLLSGGERGLLSIAFPPDYEQTRLFYAYFTDGAGDIRVDQFRRAVASRDHAEEGYRRTVIDIEHRDASNHNGGTAVFGPDGFLYLGPGDGGGGYDDGDDSRSTSSLLGKILRIAPLAGGGYAVPPGNPFGNAVWSFGLRNPYRFSFDRRTGDLAIGDVGQSKSEEIDFMPSVSGVGAGRGADFGWDECEGTFDSKPSPTGSDPCTLAGDVPPAIEKVRPGSGFCSITGGVVARDPHLEDLRGRYVYGDFCRGPVRSAVLGPTAGGDREEPGLVVSQLVSFGEDACGRLYTVELGGRVSRIEDSTPGGCAARVPEPGGGSPPPGDATVRIAGARRQPALRRGGVLVRVFCEQACGFRALGALSLRRDGRPRRLGQAVRRLTAGSSVRVKLKLSRINRRAVRRVLKRARRVTARVLIRTRGTDGRLQSSRLVVRLVR